jgi:hypothetical protein
LVILLGLVIARNVSFGFILGAISVKEDVEKFVLVVPFCGVAVD